MFVDVTDKSILLQIFLQIFKFCIQLLWGGAICFPLQGGDRQA